jgi:hypothetical protein
MKLIAIGLHAKLFNYLYVNSREDRGHLDYDSSCTKASRLLSFAETVHLAGVLTPMVLGT